MNEILKTLSKILLYISGYKNITIDDESLEKIKKSKAQIIVINHSSYIDTGTANSVFPDAKFIASSYIKNLPVIGKWAKHNCIFLKDDPNERLTDQIKEMLNNGEKIVFFSEGCCCRPDILLKLRHGAFVNNMSILPVHISYPEKNIWINGQDNMLIHYMWQLCQKENKVEVRVGKEYMPTEEDKKDVELFITNFSNYYCKTFDVALSPKNYKDHPEFKNFE